MQVLAVEEMLLTDGLERKATVFPTLGFVWSHKIVWKVKKAR